MKNENEPTQEQFELKNDHQTIFWQQNQEQGVGEPALSVRTWHGSNLIEIQQEGRSVNINEGTVDALCKTLKGYRKWMLERKES
jgi:hypothetical protein